MRSAYCEMATWSTAWGLRLRCLMLSNASAKIPAMNTCLMLTAPPMPYDQLYEALGGHQVRASPETTGGVTCTAVAYG